MKLSRNVLVGSLAVSGMVLGALAPAMTAQAATTSGEFDDKGALQSVSPNKNVNGLGTDNAGLAIAYDKGDGTTYGTATAESNANVKVVSGILTLDAVPDLGFGTAAAGSDVSLKNNTADKAEEDSQNQGLLTVTESRASAPGFTLSAGLSAFSDGTTAVTDPFILNLKATPLKDDKGANVSTGADLSSSDASITADGKAASSKNVIALAAGTYKTGAINASFTAADKDAMLHVTGAPTTPDKASSKSYNSTITWTLNADPTSTTTPSTPEA
ncbi:WxL domain-containing protein [Companilactobacillus muriivasis]|uniref:WxL domain-containing protein n=1 Tax=Companilactobacillus muriivasis TaxID=3081444 RepID=UPI0030C6A81B